MLSIRRGSARGILRVLGLAVGRALHRNAAVVLGEIAVLVARGQVISNHTGDSDNCQTPLYKFITLHKTVSLATRRVVFLYQIVCELWTFRAARVLALVPK